MSNLRRRGERIDQHRATPFTRGERGEKTRRRREENRGAFSAERPNKRRASLQEREASRDELLHLMLVDMPIVRCKGERKKREGVEQGVRGACSFVQLTGR